MKRGRSIVALAAVACAAMVLAACAYNIPAGALNYVSQAQLDKLTQMGMKINQGLTPPSIDGYYYCNDLVRTGGNIPNDSLTSFANLSLDFYSQGSDNSVKVSYNQSNIESGSGLGAFISGNGNSFTIYAQIIGTSNSINFKDAMVFSGTIASDGIHNFVYALLMTQKDPDPLGYLINVGEGRVITENDGLAATSLTYP
jgi:hypothetical protein